MNRAALTLTAAALLLTVAMCPQKPGPSIQLTGDFRAISLKSLQARLKTCHPSNHCPQAVLQMAGITRIIGAVVDEKNHDLIVFGQADKTSPPLFLEDFVVALQNAWRKYVRAEGNVRYYSHPGCSIDPTPETVQKLPSIQPQLSGSDASSLQEWGRVCHQPQRVSVMGVPFNSHFARIMVDADYYLKKLVDSNDQLDLPGFTNIMEMTIRRARDGATQDQSTLRLNRFWLYPGETFYQDATGIIVIKQCYVRLLTEQMYASAAGDMKGSGKAESLAKTFAANFTALYSKVGRQRQIYLELENLFRFVALAKAIKLKYPAVISQFGLEYLLHDHDVKETAVPRTLPGRDAVKEFQEQKDFADRRVISYQRFLSCGGVDIAIEADPKNILPDNTGWLSKLPLEIEGSRLSANRILNDPIAWDVPNQTGHLAIYERDTKTQQINRLNWLAAKLTLTFLIVDGKPRYELSDGKSSARYSLDQLPAMVRDMDAWFVSGRKKTGYLELHGFEGPDQISPIKTTINIQAGSNTNKWRLIQQQKDDSDLPELIFSEIAKDKNKSPATESETPTLETQGRYKGLYKAVAEIMVKGKKLGVAVYAKTAALAQTFIGYFRAVLFHAAATDFNVVTPAEAKARAIELMKADFPKFNDDDVIIEIEDETGKSFIVDYAAGRMVEVAE